MSIGIAADAIVVATILEVGERPAAWSGFAAVYQTVRYAVDAQVKGAGLSGLTIVVRHIVVAGSASAEPDRPGLSPTLFQPGNRLVLLLSQNGEVFSVNDERLGARIHTSALEASIRKALVAPE